MRVVYFKLFQGGAGVVLGLFRRARHGGISALLVRLLDPSGLLG
jgi:hypothetical protein